MMSTAMIITHLTPTSLFEGWRDWLTDLLAVQQDSITSADSALSQQDIALMLADAEQWNSLSGGPTGLFS